MNQRMHPASRIFCCLILGGFLALHPFECKARAVEMLGMVNYDIPQFTPKPPSYSTSNGGLGYSFFGRVEVGPGMIETGFLYAPVSMTVHQVSQDIKISSSYWTIPVLYRYSFWDPYLSLAAGVDYGIMGGTRVSINGPLSGTSISYKSHLGAVVSFQAKQDVGENLSIVLDVRYRMGLSTAIDVPDQTLGNTASKMNLTSIALGVVKHLEN